MPRLAAASEYMALAGVFISFTLGIGIILLGLPVAILRFVCEAPDAVPYRVILPLSFLAPPSRMHRWTDDPCVSSRATGGNAASRQKSNQPLMVAGPATPFLESMQPQAWWDRRCISGGVEP